MTLNGCPSGKIAYSSAQAAWRLISRRNSHSARLTHKTRGTSGNAYRCPSCGLWHITKNEERGRTPPRERQKYASAASFGMAMLAGSARHWASGEW